MLQYGGFGEARGLVFWLIVAGNGQSGGPEKSCLRPFRVFRSSSVTVPGPEPTDRRALTPALPLRTYCTPCTDDCKSGACGACA